MSDLYIFIQWVLMEYFKLEFKLLVVESNLVMVIKFSTVDLLGEFTEYFNFIDFSVYCNY